MSSEPETDATYSPTQGPPQVRRGAHRSRRSLVGALMPSVLAVAAVTALITSLAVWQGEQPDQPRADAAAAATAQATTTPPPAVTTTAPATAQAATASETTKASASASPSVEATKTKRAPKPTKTPAVAQPDRSSVQVVVLNQTSRPGLAASVAAQLRAAGWDVPAVGNFRGTVPATTVYYPAGGEALALDVAADLRTTPRTLPRFGNLSTTRFTVVVTDSFQG
jgi:hypothetical protein